MIAHAAAAASPATDQAAALDLPPQWAAPLTRLLARLPQSTPPTPTAIGIGPPLTHDETSAAPDYGTLTVDWLAGRSPNIRPACVSVLAAWLDHLGGRADSCLTATPDRVEMWLDHSFHSYFDGTPPPLTLSRNLSILRSWYAFLIRHCACDANPTARVHAPPHKTSRRPATLSCAAGAVLVEVSRQQAEEYDTERTWRDHCLVSALFHTPLPAATLAHLTFADVIGLRGTATISVWTGELHPPHTLIDLPDPVAAPLRTYLGLRTLRQNDPPTGLPQGPLFGTIPGAHDPACTTTAMSSQQINMTVKRFAAQAGLPARSQMAARPAGPSTTIHIRIPRDL